jgi:NAD+ synthase (glutamine-hydrolysing)
MTRLRLAAAALNQTPLAWDENRRHILEAISAAQAAEAAVLCLPELCLSGYGCEDQFFSRGLLETSLELLDEIIPHCTSLAVSLGLALRAGGAMYNTSALVCDGRLLGFVAKQVLAGDGIHYEPRWFQPWPAGQVEEISVAGGKYPVGDLLFDCGGVRIGMEICRDAWVPDRPGRRLAERGVDVILNPSASHFAFAKQEVRRKIVVEGSREFHASYVYSNLLGNESGRAIYDGGTLIAHQGQMLAVGSRFSYADYVLATADVDVPATTRTSGEGVVECGFTLPSPSEPREPTQPSPWDESPPAKEEEFARAVPLALFDYLRKSRAGGYVVSLSGGADSATVATMIWLLTKFGVADLGQRVFVEKLAAGNAKLATTLGAAGPQGLVRPLLACVYQATRHSGETTRHAAREVAEAIGAEFFQWNVDAMVDAYVETVSQAVGRKLTWQDDDLALQNIQARARGPGAWLLANLRGALLLTTSNRSEAAVGYATMDGDTCGGLAPITGIDKAFLLDWLKWMEKTGPVGIGPLPALAAINAQRPTAELRPPERDQTDEGDLMPYRVLDAIERAAIRDKLSPWAVFKAVQPEFPEYAAQQLGQWVERFFQLWCRNQWKRERYAPSFHLDDENLDPKTWCRFPILSGGFERELAGLRAHLSTLD